MVINTSIKKLPKLFKISLIFTCLTLTSAINFSCSSSNSVNQTTTTPTHSEETTYHAMAVSAHPLASKIGVDIMKKGGNAYDAAIAIQFALAVCYPRAGNIGGGGFMVSRDKNGNISALDFREKAPMKASTDMYLDANGNVIPNLSLEGYLASGVPGSVAGMYAVHQKFGKLKWKELLEPAIQLAANGFPITASEAGILNEFQSDFRRINGNVENPWLNSTGWEEGDSIRLPQLAKTLQLIQKYGAKGFYEGETAEIISRKMASNSGIITTSDLQNYEAVWRNPIEKQIGDYNFISMPPPSSGGIALVQLMEGLHQNRKHLGAHNDAKSVQLYTELEKRVYADRSEYLGDDDFYTVPIEELTNIDYIFERNKDINWNRATPSSDIKAGRIPDYETMETTHFSIVDEDGNAVSITTTLNGNFGSKVYIPELGFFLNNEMDDFSIKPGVPNMFGLIGSEANKIEPQKRMLSSMTPTIVEKNDQLFLVLGSPGGSTIITTVFQTITNVIYYNMPLQQAVDAKRVHHQWLPDVIIAEKGALTDQTINELQSKGYKIDFYDVLGSVNAIMAFEDGSLTGAGDPRGDNSAQGY